MLEIIHLKLVLGINKMCAESVQNTECFYTDYKICQIDLAILVRELLTNVLQTLAAEALIRIVRLQIRPCSNRQRNTDALAQGIVRTYKRRTTPRTKFLDRLDRYIHSILKIYLQR